MGLKIETIFFFLIQKIKVKIVLKFKTKLIHEKFKLALIQYLKYNINIIIS